MKRELREWEPEDIIPLLDDNRYLGRENVLGVEYDRVNGAGKAIFWVTYRTESGAKDRVMVLLGINPGGYLEAEIIPGP